MLTTQVVLPSLKRTMAHAVILCQMKNNPLGQLFDLSLSNKVRVSRPKRWLLPVFKRKEENTWEVEKCRIKRAADNMIDILLCKQANWEWIPASKLC